MAQRFHKSQTSQGYKFLNNYFYQIKLFNNNAFFNPKVKMVNAIFLVILLNPSKTVIFIVQE